MTATLALPRLARHPAWYAPLLLPVLPLLGNWLTDAGPFTGSRAACTLLLLTLGLLLSVGVPALLDHVPATIRKEANLLRDAWILGLFPAQLPLLADPAAGLVGLELMFFAVSCALLASLPLGLEFQQRTLAGLLSQPVARSESWNLKSRLLAVALALQTLVFLVSAGAQDRRFTPLFVLAAVVIAVTAWGTTPWWTLLTRGLLPGLAFSLAFPLLVIGLGYGALQFLGTDGPFETRQPDYSEPLTYLLLAVAPICAVLGAFDGARRWHRLEAPDSGGADANLLGLAHRAGTGRETLGRFPTWRLLLAKEARLQAVTLMLFGVSLLLLLLGRSSPLDTSPGSRELVLGLFALAAMTTLILAGATPIAEERRLGTLDSQLLLPVSRGALWWLKLAVGATITAGVAFQMELAFAPASEPPRGFPWPEAAQLTFLCLGTFAFALLASSTTPNALRATLATVGILCALGILIGVAVAAGAELADRANRETYASVYSEVARWKAEAEALTPAEAEALFRRGAPQSLGSSGYLPVLFALGGLPILGALVLARRNFSRPTESTLRLPVQAGACLGALALVLTVGTVLTAAAARVRAREDALVDVRSFVELERSLSPADLALWQAFHKDPYSTYVAIPLVPRPEVDPRLVPSAFSLPLSAKSRRLLIHRGQIPDSVRELLREEGTRKGEDLSPPPPEVRPTPPPPASTTPVGQLPPALMRRYGILPAK